MFIVPGGLGSGIATHLLRKEFSECVPYNAMHWALRILSEMLEKQIHPILDALSLDSNVAPAVDKISVHLPIERACTVVHRASPAEQVA